MQVVTTCRQCEILFYGCAGYTTNAPLGHAHAWSPQHLLLSSKG